MECSECGVGEVVCCVCEGQLGDGPGAQHADRQDQAAQRARAVQVAARKRLLQPEDAEVGEFGRDPAHLGEVERGRGIASHPPSSVSTVTRVASK